NGTMTSAARSTENGSSLFLARLAFADNSPITPEIVEAIHYSIYRLDDFDAAVRFPIEYHHCIPLECSAVLSKSLLKNENWPFDDDGYNFCFALDDRDALPFPKPNRDYLIIVSIKLSSDIPSVIFQYRIKIENR
ncbi:MAG: hypothetical protein ACRCUY_07730, partial [Thermoguttaceae bacterium]